MSTGMCVEEDILNAINVLNEFGVSKDQITILHCNTQYPTPFEDVNLKAMLTIKKDFGVNVGYSDHTRGIEVPIAAVALGATVIEKHFTLARADGGVDSAFSMNPAGNVQSPWRGSMARRHRRIFPSHSTILPTTTFGFW